MPTLRTTVHRRSSIRSAPVRRGLSCSLKLAKYLGEGTSRGATEKSVAPCFLLPPLCPVFMPRQPVCRPVNPTEYPEAAGSQPRSFYFRNLPDGCALSRSRLFCI